MLKRLHTVVAKREKFPLKKFLYTCDDHKIQHTILDTILLQLCTRKNTYKQIITQIFHENITCKNIWLILFSNLMNLSYNKYFRNKIRNWLIYVTMSSFETKFVIG